MSAKRNDLVILRLTMMEGRTADQKRRVMRALSEAAARELECDLESVRMVIHEVPASNWGVAGISMRERAEASARGEQ